MRTTPNLGLRLPDLPEAFDLEAHWNYNTSHIDDAVGPLLTTVAGHTQSIEGLEQTTAAQALLIQGKQDALTTAQLAAANSGITAAKLTADEAALTETIDNGAKNIFPVTATTQTVGSVVFTFNADGSITANGTKSNNDWLILSEGNALKAGMYVLSDGLPTDTENCQLIISTARSLGSAIISTAANRRPDTKTFTQDYSGLYYAIRIASGVVCNNLTFKPMICKKTDWDVSQAYQPYAQTNAELTKGKADKETFSLTAVSTTPSTSEYSYSAVVTGDIVTICLRMVLDADLAVNSSQTLLDVPTKYRPPVTCAGTGYAGDKWFQVWINTSGNLKIRVTELISSGTSINANFCYSYKPDNWTTVTPASLSMQGGETRGEPSEEPDDEEMR